MAFPRGSFSYYPIQTMPTMLDVVWSRFPQEEKPSEPGPKERPALVRSVLLYAHHTRVAVEVTYGTSRLDKVHHLDLQVCNSEEMDAAGLYQATGFRLSRTVKLP